MQDAIALEPAIRARGAALVAISGLTAAPMARDRGWFLLGSPFTPEMVHAVVRSILRGAV